MSLRSILLVFLLAGLIPHSGEGFGVSVGTAGHVHGGGNGARAAGLANWPKFQFDLGNTGFNPDETILSPANVGTLQHAWRVKAESSAASPAVVDGVIYQDSSYPSWALSAYDAVTGVKIWEADLASYIAGSSPAVAGGRVYFGTYSGLFYALDAATGDVAWTAQLDAPIQSSPAVWTGTVYVGTYAGTFYGLDALTGGARWTTNTGFMSTSSPAIANGVAYIGSTQGHLSAVDARTGDILWQAPTGSIMDSAAVSNGMVYVAAQEYHLYAFDAATGRRRWQRHLEASPFSSSPAVANGTVYMGAGKLYAFDAATGDKLWARPGGGPTAVANGVVYTAWGFDVCAYDALLGARLWCARVGPYGHSPVVVNGMVYMAGGYSLDGRLYAFGLPSQKGR